MSDTQSSLAKLPLQLRQAVMAHQGGQLEVAHPLYREFLNQHPEHPTALQLLGLLHSQRGEFEDAIALMRKSLQLFPAQPEVANNLGNALSRSGRLGEAIESYRDAIRIAPRYTEPLRNLGLCLLETNQFEDARGCFDRCLALRPGDAIAWLSLGNLHKRQSDFEAAIPCYEKALELHPQLAEAHHNLGVCLRLRQRPADALRHYEAAQRLGLDLAALHHNIGNARIDLQDADGAIEAYREAVARNPADLASHRNLNSLLWQQERLEDYLKSYREALDEHPEAVGLRLDYAMALNQQSAAEVAEQTLLQGLQHVPASSELKSLLAYSLEGQGRWDEALQWHEAAVNTPGSVPNHRISYARALLACQRPDEALREAEAGTVQIPFNQRALAYLGLCWRLLGDERDEILNDYQQYVRVYDVPTPAGYADSLEFNDRLAAVLNPLHIGRRHPPEQTMRGGSQTHGDLFLRTEPEIGALVAGLKQAVREYVTELPNHPSHPLLVRKSGAFGFAASWSVRLRPGGYHTMHVHPLGWISSAYYVQVPPEIIVSEAHGGGIKFGEPDIELGEQGVARRLIQPAVGRLVLFPSYMWHGTVPFTSGEPRMTIAFDVVPVK